jgi:hypothetical protein
MILRNFTDDANRLWFWRRDWNRFEAKPTTTENIFVENDLYTVNSSDGTVDVSLELFFSQLEAVSANFFRQLFQIVRSGKIPMFDESSWNFWSHFYYYSMKRTPGFIDSITTRTGFFERIRSDAAADKISYGRDIGGEEFEVSLKRIADDAIVHAISEPPSEEILSLLGTMGIIVHRIIDPRLSFVVGDIPGAAVTFRGEVNSPPAGSVFFPVSHDLAIGLLSNSRSVEVVAVDRDQVRKMNIATTSRSRMIAGKHPKLIYSLARSAPDKGVEQVISS